MTRTRRRFPSMVYRHGSEPDARFSLANERTYLAWIRTALAFLAGGVALEVLGPDLQPDLRLAASVLLIVAGILTPVQAWIGWARTERALRLNRALPSASLAMPLAVVLFAAGTLILLGIIYA